ncbi:hypothetical protein ACFYZB_00680 [Streptomyces sp. NPDC001852]|uniref:hypothetical protein n=1 Tax=Streptomyces sp. NPDC001852 TaxID=3364619 RepID=UPI00368D24D8
MAEQKSSSALTAPLRGAASVLRRVPSAGMVSRAAEGTLDKVGAVSPRGRRIAVYAGAGVLGAAGVVEWPVALTGAAVAWLTQPRPPHPADGGAGQCPEPAHDLGTAALRSGHGGRGRDARGTGAAEGGGGAESPGEAWDAGAAEAGVEAAGAAEASAGSRTPGSTGTRTSSRRAGGTGTPGGATASRTGRTSGESKTTGSATASRSRHTTGGTGATGSARTAGSRKTPGGARTTHGAESAVGNPSTGPFEPTARPDRTTL